MFEPLDLIQVRRDQRRTATLLGLSSENCPVGKSHHSFLPSIYWGKPKDVIPGVKPNFAFIRGDLQRLSLPAIAKGQSPANGHIGVKQSHDGHQRAQHPLGFKHSQKHLGRQGAITKGRKTNPTSQSLPLLNPDQARDYRRLGDNSGGNVNLGSNPSRLLSTKEAWKHAGGGSGTVVNRNFQQSDGGNDKMVNGNIQQRLTIHVPGEDGSRGHVTVHKLNSSDDVLPPLVSIHSSVSTSRNPQAADSYFMYHHALNDDRPNLPHSDSNLSNASLGLSKSPPFHILSVDKPTRWLQDSPVINQDGNISFRKGNIKLRGSVRKKHELGSDSTPSEQQYQSLESFGFQSVSKSEIVNQGPEMAVSESDYSSVSAPSPGLEDAGVFSDDFWDNQSLDEVETLVQDSPLPVVKQKTPTITEVIQRFQPPKKPSRLSGTDVKNVHRYAYLSALSVARCHQLPTDSSSLGKRFTRPFQFSYFKHIPHQKPCCCAECRERKLSNSIIPRKGKAAKLSPIKAIFGKVKVDDYYPRRILP